MENFLKPFELNVLETHMRESISKKFNDGRILSNARTAHITEGTKPGLGRVTCQYRNRCMRGCSYGAYLVVIPQPFLLLRQPET